MNVLVRKMSSLKLLKVELILGTIFLAVAMIAIPVSIFCLAPDLLREPLAWGIAASAMLFFGLVGYGLFVRRRSGGCAGTCEGHPGARGCDGIYFSHEKPSGGSVLVPPA